MFQIKLKISIPINKKEIQEYINRVSTKNLPWWINFTYQTLQAQICLSFILSYKNLSVIFMNISFFPFELLHKEENN